MNSRYWKGKEIIINESSRTKKNRKFQKWQKWQSK